MVLKRRRESVCRDDLHLIEKKHGSISLRLRNEGLKKQISRIDQIACGRQREEWCVSCGLGASESAAADITDTADTVTIYLSQCL